jgi:glycosyltransferase involved in cell wall biosynthesis
MSGIRSIEIWRSSSRDVPRLTEPRAAGATMNRELWNRPEGVPLKLKVKRIAFLIRSLDYGGAEMQLTVLANGLARAGRSVSVLVFYPNGALCERLSPDVTVRCLGKRSRWHLMGFLRSLFRVLDEERPDALYAFLPGANLLACLTRLRSRKMKLAWGVRASYVDPTRYDWLSRLIYWLERRFSRCPDLIISNSEAGRRHAVTRGFPDNGRFIVIPNGIDIEHFRPDRRMRAAVRREWDVRPDEMLVGIVARLDPMKDYPNFLQAAAKLARRERGVRFVSVGTGPEDYAAILREQARKLGLDQRMIWAGPRGDLPAVYNALDLLVSSSFGEGFSNVLGEAMACGVPCVATDVGDAREILGDTHTVAPARNPDALVESIGALLGRLRTDGASLGARARERIAENYSVEALVQRTKLALETMP